MQQALPAPRNVFSISEETDLINPVLLPVTGEQRRLRQYPHDQVSTAHPVDGVTALPLRRDWMLGCIPLRRWLSKPTYFGTINTCKVHIFHSYTRISDNLAWTIIAKPDRWSRHLLRLFAGP